MKWLKNLAESIPEWILGIISIVVFCVIAWATGGVYRKFLVLWVCLWLLTPVIAFIVGTGKLDAYLTEKGMKSLYVWLMVFAVVMSFILFFDDDLRVRFGHYFFKGSKFWIADTGMEDDDGNPETAYTFYAPTAWGRFVLRAFNWVKMGLCVLLPLILHKSFEHAIRVQEQKRCEQQRLELESGTFSLRKQV
jgi:hypothetical protein